MAVPRILRLRRESYGFAIGSLFFMVGATPPYAAAVGAWVGNATFFVGSLFFTAAGFIQLSLSGRRPPGRESNRADRFDWWSAAVQFLGTLFFNLSTYEALATVRNGPGPTGDGWRPDAFGSVAFLVSSAFAVVATTERDRLWDPRARTWRCSSLNMAGSVLFALSAVGAYTIPETGDVLDLFWANLGTFTGALCFFIAAVLSRPTTAAVREARRSPSA